MLHLLNGDATAAVFPDSLPGKRAVWRESEAMLARAGGQSGEFFWVFPPPRRS